MYWNIYFSSSPPLYYSWGSISTFNVYSWIIITEFYFRIVKGMLQNICHEKGTWVWQGWEPLYWSIDLLDTALRTLMIVFSLFGYPHFLLLPPQTGAAPGGPSICWSHTSLALREAMPDSIVYTPVQFQWCHSLLLRHFAAFPSPTVTSFLSHPHSNLLLNSSLFWTVCPVRIWAMSLLIVFKCLFL